jgi:hypothetical protein
LLAFRTGAGEEVTALKTCPPDGDKFHFELINCFGVSSMTQQATETEFGNIHTNEWNLANKMSTKGGCCLIEVAASRANPLGSSFSGW